MAYDTNNIFAKILRGEIPCVKVYEDDKTLAFMDVMPEADGHVLVVPKEPAENILDLSADGMAAMMATTQKVAKAVDKALKPDGILLKQYNRAPRARAFSTSISTSCRARKACHWRRMAKSWYRRPSLNPLPPRYGVHCDPRTRHDSP